MKEEIAMSTTLTVSFHGGSSPNAVNNLLSYPQGGSGTPILNPAGVTLDELRGFTLEPNGDLYVVVGNKNNSNILQFTPPVPPSVDYTDGTAFVPPSELSHPFALVFAGASLFVSNQDDNKIRQFSASTGDYIQDFADGFNTLRGIAAGAAYLFAADEKGGKDQKGEVSWYALPTSASQSKASKAGHVDVEDCVHLMYDGSRYLYIGSEKTSEIYLLDTQNLANAPTQLVLPAISATPPATMQDLAGMAIASGNLYVASRKGLFIAQYTLDTSTTPPTVSGQGSIFVGSLPDEPEFVAALGVAGAVSG
jgi:hypothetical protein